MSLKVALKESLDVRDSMDLPEAKIWMRVDTHRQLRRLSSCRNEPETVRWLQAGFKSGDVLYDIGANVGAYSLVAWAVAGQDATIYAIEPSFSTFAALSANVYVNRCSGKIIPLHVALADKTDLLTLNYAGLAAGDANHVLSEPGREIEAVFAQPILTYRLDDLVRVFRLKPPTHIKMDVDSTERELLIVKGACETLASPELGSLLIEVDESSPCCQELIETLENAGFDRKSRHGRVRASTVFNYIFEKTRREVA